MSDLGAGWTFESAAACVARQDWPAARSAYSWLAQAHPTHAELQCNLGLIEQMLDDCPSALLRFDRAVELAPSQSRPRLLRADLHKACHRLEAALADYDAALDPASLDVATQAHVHANRGTTLHALGRHDEALESFDRAMQCDERTPGVHYNRGNALRSLRRHEEALVSFDRALEADPVDVQAQFNRSISLGALDRWLEALEAADSVIVHNPGHAGAHSARGDWLKNLGRGDEALAAYDQALVLDDHMAATHLNRGNTLRELDRPQEALMAYDRAVALDPSDWEGHYNRGIALHDLRRLPQAMNAYSLARRLAPQEARIEWNEALALLLSQRWHEGWLAYEARWSLEPPMAGLADRAGRSWRGGGVAGCRMLLVAEQGLGDTLQFCRYVPHVVALGAEVTLLVPPSLHSLLDSAWSGVRVLSTIEPAERFDFHCPLMSLPLALQRFDPLDGGSLPYLRADAALVSDHARQHPRTSRPRVGLAWSGNRANLSDARRSVALSDFVQALAPGWVPVVLQSEVRPEDELALAALQDVIHAPAELEGFARTAAWCESVDLVLTVDTSIAHLAGALGRPTWVLLHHASDWRWLMDREDSPWYPHTRLFRQRTPGQWGEVLQRVRSALELALDLYPGAQPLLGAPDVQAQPGGAPAQ